MHRLSSIALVSLFLITAACVPSDKDEPDPGTDTGSDSGDEPVDSGDTGTDCTEEQTYYQDTDDDGFGSDVSVARNTWLGSRMYRASMLVGQGEASRSGSVVDAGSGASR